ncbi:MAG TPA: molybdopterin cofactor-binding domain-containing protein [Pseudolabrys sp.]|nr:molybdopterin cofactor-binding domain-containing protein [Pseudolabrys sp.]
MNIQISRRDALLGSGALVVSFALADSLTGVQAQTTAKPLALTEVDSFLAIDKTGKVTVYSGKVDLGTGVTTALRQIVADELDVPLSRIELITGDTMLTPDQGTTWASVTIQVGGMQLRQAAAVARQALLAEAAKKLGTDNLTVADGVIMAGGRKKVSYGELIGGKSFSIKLDPKQPVKEKSPKDYKIVGKSTPRVDIPDKVTGRFTYMQDFRVPGMLYGRVVRPPAIGAKLEKVDESATKKIPGVARVVREGNFLGVVATNEWDAIRGADALKVTWSKSETLPDQAKLWEYVRASKVAKEEEYGKTGNTAEAMAKDGVKIIKATYDFAINTHGSIGPSCAVAEFKDGALTSWSASQATHALRKQLAQMFSLPLEKVRCIYIEGSGCYGRNGHEDAAADAALLSKIVGTPVRVQWSRADEHGWDPKGPPTLMDMRASMDAQGNVTAWEGDFYMPQQTPGGFFVPLVAATLSGMPAANHIAPGNVFQNSAIGYKFPNTRSVCKRLETTPFRPSWIRTPGRMQNTYANECFMDELAAAANMDPLEFRRKYLDDKRGLELLERLAALAKWEKRPSPLKNASGTVGKGRGISYVKYELVRTYIGAVAEVEVDRRTGVIRVPKFTLVHDCGQIINPDGLKNQIEGNVIQTVSRTLIEELKFDRSQVTSLDWASYPILKFPQVPDIVIELIDRPNEKPWGAGEPAAAVIPAAISNAVFDATGVRLRSIPYTPAKVLAAMHAI